MYFSNRKTALFWRFLLNSADNLWKLSALLLEQHEAWRKTSKKWNFAFAKKFREIEGVIFFLSKCHRLSLFHPKKTRFSSEFW